VKILANPILLKAVIVLIFAGCAFLVGLLFIRMLRKNIVEEGIISDDPAPSLESLPLHLYNTVIQQLKQQKHELLVQSQAEQHRAKTSETFSQAVLTNLSSGVVVFGANGLVKTANPAAKEILGFASTTGMSAEDIFRGALVDRGRTLAEEDGSGLTGGAQVAVSDEIHVVLREDSKQRQVQSEYETPAGAKRFIQMTISPVPSMDGGLLGVACLINDRTEVETIRRQQERHGELSAEMALQLRTSLSTISGYAQQLASNRDPELAVQLATDIAQEAAQLDRTIGGFLTTSRAAKGATAGNSKVLA